MQATCPFHLAVGKVGAWQFSRSSSSLLHCTGPTAQHWSWPWTPPRGLPRVRCQNGNHSCLLRFATELFVWKLRPISALSPPYDSSSRRAQAPVVRVPPQPFAILVAWLPGPSCLHLLVQLQNCQHFCCHQSFNVLSSGFLNENSKIFLASFSCSF